MIARTLHLEPAAGHSTATVEAWCLTSGAAEAWLEEIDRWQLRDASRLRLFVMPASSNSRKAAGLFVIGHPTDPPKVRPAGLAFVRRGRSLYLPQD
ncbi:MAG TPA: hypothetical protein VK956_00735, partial [Verrucomicrobium sp.]|nr:hypothetical protein [Verrucomicrobium sp.]